MTLKTKVAVVAVLVAGIAIVGAGRTKSSGTYDVTVDTIEGCSCPLFCTCYFGPSADEHMCQANNVYKFRKGSHYGDVDLSDQIVWINLDLGGEWHHKPRPRNADRLGARDLRQEVLAGPARRDRQDRERRLPRQVEEVRHTRRLDHLAGRRQGGRTPRWRAASPRSRSTRPRRNRPDKNEPVVVKNLQYWFSTSNGGFVLAYSTHHFDGADGNPKYSYKNRNGFTIAWTAKGDIKPEPRRPRRSS